MNKGLIILALIIGIVGVALWGLSIPKYGLALDTLKVGYIDINKVLENHPKIEKAKKDINDFAIKARADYQKQLDEAVKNKTATEAQQLKTEYEVKLNQVVAQKQQEILRPILDDIRSVIRDIAKKKGIDIVLREEVVVVGGVDLTEDVVKAIKK
ncbi:MAG: OmpH family outer membrane protein [bacterium]|nr:OmpH family outer membrane protein [bacterium]